MRSAADFILSYQLNLYLRSRIPPIQSSDQPVICNKQLKSLEASIKSIEQASKQASKIQGHEEATITLTSSTFSTFSHFNLSSST
jgi:hypothetical protein